MGVTHDSGRVGGIWNLRAAPDQPYSVVGEIAMTRFLVVAVAAVLCFGIVLQKQYRNRNRRRDLLLLKQPGASDAEDDRYLGLAAMGIED